MPLYFITGIAGSGKSELTLGLRERGYEALDTDDDALARWQNVETGYIHPKSSVKAKDRTAEFLRQHNWNVPRQSIEELAARAKNKPVFVCGTANNMDELRDLFSTVFALVIDDETLRVRLANRTGNDWGKQPHELQQTLEAQGRAMDAYRDLGYVIIDGTLPREQVIDRILEHDIR